MPTLNLTPAVAELLVDVIDIHVQGIADAKNLTIGDPTVDTADQLLDLMAGYDGDMLALKDIRAQLVDKPPVPRTAEEKIAFRKDWDRRYEEGQHRDSGS